MARIITKEQFLAHAAVRALLLPMLVTDPDESDRRQLLLARADKLIGLDPRDRTRSTSMKVAEEILQMFEGEIVGESTRPEQPTVPEGA